ncbi:hypothetical protein K461DRAFT_149051 [Myriangium duriaei CBS 260.36]|uniref:Uncharacterized protein n=1 Tax=Myriangium duriaei CBS 260.36 TaxID=1168546 RepID=A0A9P4J178_9PEZI|nr:hypothetical protein K461DRAFT_149051 [Myriangium duriaei CBS 260.36]
MVLAGLSIAGNVPRVVHQNLKQRVLMCSSCHNGSELVIANSICNNSLQSADDQYQSRSQLEMKWTIKLRAILIILTNILSCICCSIAEAEWRWIHGLGSLLQIL